jgi:hypothetical protein
MDGASSSSSSVKIHCISDSMTAGGGGLGGSRCGGIALLVVDTITGDGSTKRCVSMRVSGCTDGEWSMSSGSVVQSSRCWRI